MAERHYVGVYWEDRPDSREGCASQVAGTLSRLRAHDPLLSRWYLKLGSREESLQAELPEGNEDAMLAAALALLAEEAPALGWRVTVWNGLDAGRSAHVDLVVGAHPNIIFSPTPNSCILNMPRGRELPEVDALLRRTRMTALLGELAQAWRADWGVASTDSYLMSIPPVRPSHHPRVGWLTFLNARRGRAPALPKAHVTPVDGLGYVVGTQDDTFTADDGSASARVGDIENALEGARRLHPAGESPGPDLAGEPRTATNDGPRTDAESPGSDAYAAALDAACAVDALCSHLPGRRADLADSLLRASTSLVVAVATGDDPTHKTAEMRALLDLTRRLFPDTAAAEMARADDALARLKP